MFRRNHVAIPCRLSPGMVSGERFFSVKLANGTDYSAVAPRFFFWNSLKKLIEKNEPTTEDSGLIAARIVDELDDEQVSVEVPSGAVIAVNSSDIHERPTELKPPSPTFVES